MYLRQYVTAAAVAAVLAMPGAGWAQTQSPGGGASSPSPGHPMTMPQNHGAGGSPMMQPMQDMQRRMAGVPLTGDADHDFAALMIPHHQAAIDMAQLELKQGKDPQMRKLAQSIVTAQQKEIARMKDWQAGHQRSGH